MKSQTPQRRFEHLPKGDPDEVRPLPADHAAMAENRTLFPSTVVDPKDSNSLLISGQNNRKIGRVVTKGPWAGMPIYTLTLEERATCPASCFMYSACYGNAMHFARRHRHGPELEAFLAGELVDLADDHPDGFVVRLHVLGDFYSEDYVWFWHRQMQIHPMLRIYGYTARSQAKDPEIHKAIFTLNAKFPDRSFIRFSSKYPQPFGATVITRNPEAAVVPEGVVCPAETSDAECCATCGLCWSPAMRAKTIVFVQHGRGSSARRAEARSTSRVDANGMRPVRPMNFGPRKVNPITGNILEFREVAPTDLYVDETYQRELTSKSASLIQRISHNWDWRYFNPPTVVLDSDGRLHVIDGQHTAIAAATRDDIEKIMVKIVNADSRQERAMAFVQMNRSRLAVTASQIYFAEIAAGLAEAVGVQRMCAAAGVKILKYPPHRGILGAGETLSVQWIRKIWRNPGEKVGVRILRIIASARMPANEWLLRAINILLVDSKYKPRLADEKITDFLIANKDTLLNRAVALSGEIGQHRGTACAEIIWRELK